MGNDSNHLSLVVMRLKWSCRKWVLDDPMGTGHPVNLHPIGFWKNAKHRNKMRMRITRHPWWWLENSEMAREFISEHERVVSMYWCGFWKETRASRSRPLWPVRPLTSTLSPVTPADLSPSTPSFWLEQRVCFGWRNVFYSITFYMWLSIVPKTDHINHSCSLHPSLRETQSFLMQT